MKHDSSSPCPCCSGASYETCCRPFHDRSRIPSSALELMRSRFSAYALDLPHYIIATTHPASPHYRNDLEAWKQQLSLFSQNTSFQRLAVLQSQEKALQATVTFTATLEQEGQDASFTEKSYFEKLSGRWYYRGGQLNQSHSPTLVTTEEMRLLPLAYYGEPVLRKKADPIAEITDEVRRLVDEMVETMEAGNGVGLAAPQVHHSIRLFVICVPESMQPDYPDVEKMQIFINPKLSAPSKESWTEEEGCLSIPGIRGLVERPKEITVTYTNLDGEEKQQRFSGWPARIIMHENDHINGVLFIDRLSPKERQRVQGALKSLENRLKDHRSL